jgi:hypothetical protein
VIQNYLQEIFPQNTHIPKNTSGTYEGEPTRHSIFGGNYAHKSSGVVRQEFYVGITFCQK